MYNILITAALILGIKYILLNAVKRFINGAPDRIRTCDFHLRRVALYPAELRALTGRQYIRFIKGNN